METNRFLLLRELFDRAMALPETERDAYLERACNGDAALLSEAQAVMAAHQDSAAGSGNPAVAPLDRQIGPYRLRSQIGEGGMGTVFLAIRDDGAFRKSVALKILRRDQASTEFVERFQQERQTLANLDHANIARILDGGQTPDGLPYYVMEYVDGLPIDKFCDQRKLDLQGRVEVFQQVCQAVHYLHEHLVVHRDLKPSNILVTGEGTVKLLDFGIAKQQMAAANAELTAVQGRLMTPGFASPEQFSGAPVTKASDIYSLGVILYLLLTGTVPHADPSQKLTTEPSAPSSKIREDIQRTRETTSELRRRLTGDLDQVVLMCLRRNPSTRYASAKELADDLRRFLDSRPVAARKGPAAERLGRFVKRNRIAVAVAGVIFVLGLFGAWQGLEAQIQTRRAVEREAEIGRLLDALDQRGSQDAVPRVHAGDIKRLREAIDRDIAPDAQRLTPQRDALLRRGVKFLDKVKPLAASDSALAGEVAQTYKQVGAIYRPVAPQMALTVFSSAASVLSAAFSGEPEKSPYHAEWLFLAGQIQSLGGVLPQPAPPQQPDSSEAPLSRQPRLVARASRQTTEAISPTAVPTPEPAAPRAPDAAFRMRVDSVSAKVQAADDVYRQVQDLARQQGHIAHPEISTTYNRMKSAYDSADRSAQAGDTEAAKEHLDIAEASAAKLLKQIGH